MSIELKDYEHVIKSVVGKKAAKIPYNLRHLLSYEDLLQIGYEVFLKCSESYAPTKGAKFETYLYLKIGWAIAEEVRQTGFVHGKAFKRCKTNQERKDLNRLNNIQYGMDMNYFTDDGNTTPEQEIDYIKLESLLLDDLPFDLKTKFYLKQQGLRYTEIATMYGVTGSRIAQQFMMLRQITTKRLAAACV